MASLALLTSIVGKADPAAGQGSGLGVGEVATLAGPIEAGSGGLEVDAAGNVYTADFGATLSRGPMGTRVFRITPDGEVEVFAEGFRGASGNTIDSRGRFFQANIGGNRIDLVGSDGTLTEYATGLTNPVGIAFDGKDLLVANCGANTIVRVKPGGEVQAFASSDLLQCPNGLVAGDAGRFYVSNFSNGDVLRISAAGEVERFATLPGENNGHLVYAGNVFYVAARSAHQIFKLSRDGTLEVVAGSGGHGVDDGPALEATLSFPNDLALSPDGSILYWNDVSAIVENGGQTLAPTVVRMLRLR